MLISTPHQLNYFWRNLLINLASTKKCHKTTCYICGAGFRGKKPRSSNSLPNVKHFNLSLKAILSTIVKFCYIKIIISYKLRILGRVRIASKLFQLSNYQCKKLKMDQCFYRKTELCNTPMQGTAV